MKHVLIRGNPSTSDTMPIEETLALIKPDAFEKADKIEKEITDNGFIIIKKEKLKLSTEDAKEFYKEHEEKPFFNELVDYITSGNIVAMILSKENAVTDWRNLLGPTSVSEAKGIAPSSIRAKYGSEENNSHNAAHGSDSTVSAAREITILFSRKESPKIAIGTAKEYLTKTVSPSLVEGLSELCKERPQDPIVWLADWLLLHNPKQKVVRN